MTDSNIAIPLNAGQTGIYLECASSPQTRKYNIPVLVKLPEGIGRERLIDAVTRAASEHEALFCRVCEVRGVPMLQRSDLPFEVRIAKVQSIDEEAETFCRPLDLQNGPR